MKYQHKQMGNGNWAVFTGKRYFPKTVTLDESEAHKEALIMSGHWYQRQMDECEREMEKAGFLNGDNGDSRCFTDYMA